MEAEVWGTWEELILVGAVLRYGTADWDAVASELRARTIHPYGFLSEVCKSRYEDLQRHYSCCNALFEELRMQRMAELKRSLEQSDDSIGSLRTKLDGLKSEGEHFHVDQNSSQTEPPSPSPNADRVHSSAREMSNDGLSAGSFTQEMQTNWKDGCRVSAGASSREREIKQEVSAPFPNLEYLAGGGGVCIRKRRGKRQRKHCNRDTIEGSTGESNFWGSSDAGCKENLTSECTNQCTNVADDLVAIYDYITQNEIASIFHRQLDSQKRTRYRNLVRQHIDFETIRSRIADRSIKSARELFRDLLLLVTNAIVFYSKRSREHKAARLLRNFVTDTLLEHNKNKCIVPTSPMPDRSVKPRSARPYSHKLFGHGGNALVLEGGEKPTSVDSSCSVCSLGLVKEGYSWERKWGRRATGKRLDALQKGRKRRRGR